MNDKIDVTFTMPFVGPFVALAIIKLVWWMAGADGNPEAMAVAALLLGVAIGGLVSALCWSGGYKITIPNFWRK